MTERLSQVAFLIVAIPGKPIAKGRPRISPNGGVFTPSRTREAETTLRVKEPDANNG